MGQYHSIKINHNSDCWGETEALKELLRKNKRYLAKDFTAAEIVSIAVDELYDRLNAEKRNSENQRCI